MKKKGQIYSRDIINFIGAGIALIFIIPIISLIFGSISINNIEQALESIINLFIPLFILAIFVEFFRRIIR